jgi:hypothetical protein
MKSGVRALETLLQNTVDRDGMYYETSLLYGDFTKSVFIDIAEMLVTLWRGASPWNWEAGRFNFFEYDKMSELIVDNFDLTVAGHELNFGDSHADREIITRPDQEFSPNSWTLLARYLRYVRNPDLRSRVANLLSIDLGNRDPAKAASEWWMFNLRGSIHGRFGRLPPAPPAPIDISSIGNGKFFSTKGLAAFQSGYWPSRRGFAVRGGPNLPHSHDDLLGLNLYDLGRELSAEIGYGVFDSHIHKGWGSRAVSHDLVVVDEDRDLSPNDYYKSGPGANWRSFYVGKRVRYMDADGSSQFSPASGISQYRRRIAMVDVNSSSSYYLDFFEVAGGKTRDYSFHAPYNDQLLTSALTISGVKLHPEGSWTLAGLQPERQSADWNSPGRSWGERVVAGEYIRKLSPNDGVGGYGWQPPGNGYGFLYNIRGADLTTSCSATYALQGTDEAYLRATFLPIGKAKLFAANAPDISGKHLLNYVICRDDGSSRSRFVVLIEPYRTKPLISSARFLVNSPGACAVCVKLANGDEHVLVMGDSAERPVKFNLSNDTDISVSAEFAFLRFDSKSSGKPAEIEMMRGRECDVNGKVLLQSPDCITGKIRSVDEIDRSVVVELNESVTTPVVDRMNFAVISSKDYTHSTSIQIRDNGKMIGGPRMIRLRTGSAVLQRADMSSMRDNVCSSSMPMPLGFAYDKSTHFLEGKALVNSHDVIVGRIKEMLGMKQFKIEDYDGKTEDHLLNVYDFVPGDEVDLPLWSRWPAAQSSHPDNQNSFVNNFVREFMHEFEQRKSSVSK